MWNFAGNARPSFAVQPQAGEESVWDYPRPPVCVDDSRLITVALGDKVIAETRKSIRVLETASPPTFYLPPSDVNLELLRREQGNTLCEWKGVATYWTLVSGSATVADIRSVAWSYENPNPVFEVIRGYVSFYPAKLVCHVAGERVRPQPGGFYGGWLTSEIVGPVKGETGTGSW